VGQSARPKSLNKPIACKECGVRTFPVTSTMECKDCNPKLFHKEYQIDKEYRK
jgi:DNA-directed RNA polymerase subunit RPC12/RpoP